MNRILRNPRILSVLSFSFLSAYLLSFVFEGQVLYNSLEAFGMDSYSYIIYAIISHFFGLFLTGYLVKSYKMAKLTIAISIAVCLLSTLPFFFEPSLLWGIGLLISGFSAGCVVSSWGYFLKEFTPKNERIKSCADMLILSNIIMTAIKVITLNSSHVTGLLLSLLCLVIGGVLLWKLPNTLQSPQMTIHNSENKSLGDIKKPLLILFSFITIITINSGLMYQVINPAFDHLKDFVSWYWALPYIIALVFMRNLSTKNKIQGPLFLYVGMTMIIMAFISFMLLSCGPVDYFVVNTLMLGAFGIFDLFWWSIIGEMLDYSNNPIMIFGFGLSANVLGVLLGDILGVSINTIKIPEAEVTVIALTVTCITLVIMPPLNRQLVLLLKNHLYLSAYEGMEKKQQEEIIYHTKLIEPLTEREHEVLKLLLAGKSNKEISSALFITESTVKTHVRNIFSKYDVSSRAELISTLLKNQAHT